MLCALTPLPESLVTLWIDSAKLVALVGAKRYQTLKATCITASEFIVRSDEQDFLAEIKEKCGIENAPEIRRLLEEQF